MHYADVETDTTGQSVLTHTDEQVFVTTPTAPGFTLHPDLAGPDERARSARASRTSPPRARRAGLYGAAGMVSAKPFYVTTQGNTPVDWTVAQPVHPTGTRAPAPAPSSIDFPPTLPPAQHPGDVFIGAFTGTLNDGPHAAARRQGPPVAHDRRRSDVDVDRRRGSGASPAERAGLRRQVRPGHADDDLRGHRSRRVHHDSTTARRGTAWATDFPMVPVRDIYVAKNQDFIRVATYGRGLWEIYPSAGANHGAPGNGDYDRNLQDRLGRSRRDVGAARRDAGDHDAAATTPGSSTSPAGGDHAGTAIDDADLNALLAHVRRSPVKRRRSRPARCARRVR